MGIRGNLPVTRWGICALLGILISGPAVSDGPEPLRLYEYVYEVDVIATVPRGGPGCAGDSDPVTVTTVHRGLTPVVCTPDPYDDMCRSVSPEIRRHRVNLAVAARKLDQVAVGHYQRARAHVDSTLGRLEAHAGDESFTNKYFDAVLSRTEETLSQGRRADVERHVGLALDAFVDTLRGSRMLGSGDVTSIERYLRRCASRPKIDLAALRTLNGSMLAIADGQHMESDLRDGMRIDPIADGVNCEMKVSGKIWEECAEGRPSCYFVLFHEFGHAIQSCEFLENARYQRLAREYVKENTSYWDRFRRARMEIFEIGERRAREIADLMEEASSCLAELSPEDPPREAISSSCDTYDVPMGDKLRSRCSWEALPGYNSQWGEAEADFWAASAMGKWLERSYHEPHNRYRAMHELAASWCSDGDVLAYVPSQLKTKIDADRAAARPPVAPAGTAGGGAARATANAASDAGATPACTTVPAAGAPSPLPPPRDEHQSWKTRINRYVLRNTDLRHALGCKGGTLPLTCAPTGVRTMPIPR